MTPTPLPDLFPRSQPPPPLPSRPELNKTPTRRRQHRLRRHPPFPLLPPLTPTIIPILTSTNPATPTPTATPISTPAPLPLPNIHLSRFLPFRHLLLTIRRRRPIPHHPPLQIPRPAPPPHRRRHRNRVPAGLARGVEALALDDGDDCGGRGTVVAAAAAVAPVDEEGGEADEEDDADGDEDPGPGVGGGGRGEVGGERGGGTGGGGGVLFHFLFGGGGWDRYGADDVPVIWGRVFSVDEQRQKPGDGVGRGRAREKIGGGRLPNKNNRLV